jgi:hypothetical protein
MQPVSAQQGDWGPSRQAIRRVSSDTDNMRGHTETNIPGRVEEFSCINGANINQLKGIE